MHKCQSIQLLLALIITLLLQSASASSSSNIHIPLYRKAAPDLHQRARSLSARHDNIPSVLETDYVKSSLAHLQTRYSHDKRANSSTAQEVDVKLLNYISDTSYLAAVSIGTPTKNFWVTMDTGSSDFFLTSPSCSDDLCPTSQFDPSSSSSFMNTSNSFKYVYGSGTVVGSLGKDSLSLGGFTVNNSTVGLVSNLSGNLVGNPASGLMGLAWQDLSVTKATPFWQTLASEGSIAMFSFFLTHIEPTETGLAAGGIVTLGQEPDPTIYTGAINWVDVPTQKYWGIPLAGLKVNGQSISVSDGSSPLAIIDTGSTLISAPTTVCNSIYSQLGGSLVTEGTYSGYYTYTCSMFTNFTLKFGDIEYEVTKSNFAFSMVNQTTCIGAIVPVDSTTTKGSFTVGDAFLKNVLSVFRYSPASVGFAALSSSAEASATIADPVPTFSSARALQTAESKDLSSSSTHAASFVQSWILAAALTVF